MTPALDALLKEVEALDKRATKGPWVAENYTCECCSHVHAAKATSNFDAGRLEGDREDDVMYTVHGHPATAPFNAPAIAHYRTAAPRLAAMLRVAVDALDAGFNLVNGRAECRRALARIEAMAKGDA